MKRILALIAVFVTFMVWNPESRANLGQTIEEFKTDHPDATLQRTNQFDNRATLYVFKDATWEYDVLTLDKLSAAEYFSRTNDAVLDEEFIMAKIHEYAEVWEPADSGLPDAYAAESVDGRFFAVLGHSDAVGKDNVLAILTREWRDYCKQKMDALRNSKLKI
jgi:hypothetical protein